MTTGFKYPNLKLDLRKMDSSDNKTSSPPPEEHSPSSYTRTSSQSPLGSIFGGIRGIFSNKTATIAGVLVLVLGLGAGVVAVQRSTEYRQHASEDTRPLVCGKIGDVNRDAVISSKDSDEILAKTVGKPPIIYYAPESADVNADGKINTADALLISQYVSKTINTFPACGKITPTSIKTPTPAPSLIKTGCVKSPAYTGDLCTGYRLITSLSSSACYVTLEKCLPNQGQGTCVKSPVYVGDSCTGYRAMPGVSRSCYNLTQCLQILGPTAAPTARPTATPRPISTSGPTKAPTPTPVPSLKITLSISQYCSGSSGNIAYANVQWNSIPTASKYSIWQWNTPTAGTWNLLNYSTATAYPLILKQGQGYTLRTTAENSAGYTISTSNVVGFTARTCP